MAFTVGSVIMKCKPLVHTLNNKQKSNRCDFCFKTNDNLRKCSKCQSMYYCDQKCQRMDWSECHRQECRIYADHYGRCLTGDCDRLLLRLHLTLENRPEMRSQTHELFNGQKRCFDDLMTHNEDIITDGQRMKNFAAICDRFRACLLVFDYEHLLDLFCRLCINSFSILNEELNDIGSGIYVTGSVFNHSCSPNAAIVFDGIELEARVLKPIPAGEEVVINYVDVKATGIDRRLKLRDQYYFDCQCSKCVTNSDNDIDYSLVKSLNDEFDALIDSQDNWRKCYSIGSQSIPLYKQIYGDFHPDITVQLMRVLKVLLLIVDDLRDTKVLEMINTTRDSLEITHGFHHRLCDVLKDAVSL